MVKSFRDALGTKSRAHGVPYQVDYGVVRIHHCGQYLMADEARTCLAPSFAIGLADIAIRQILPNQPRNILRKYCSSNRFRRAMTLDPEIHVRMEGQKTSLP
jgi:hypothetical protein